MRTLTFLISCCVLLLLYVMILHGRNYSGIYTQEMTSREFGSKFRQCGKMFPRIYLPSFTYEELGRIDQCVMTSDRQRKRSERRWKTGTDENSHSYLLPSSKVIELGGNRGVFAKNMLRKYKLQSYIVLEPMKRFYQNLSIELPKYTGKLQVLNFGLGKTNKMIELRDMDDGTSAFLNSSDPRYTERPMSFIRIVNAIEFFLSLGIGCSEVDLLSMNCEGCEIEVLEMLIETNMIKYFKNIQFQLHTNLKHLKDVKRRYCQIRERLPRTHKVLYSFPFIWEGWQRKDQS